MQGHKISSHQFSSCDVCEIIRLTKRRRRLLVATTFFISFLPVHSAFRSFFNPVQVDKIEHIGRISISLFGINIRIRVLFFTELAAAKPSPFLVILINAFKQPPKRRRILVASRIFTAFYKSDCRQNTTITEKNLKARFIRAGSTAGRGGKGTQISHTHIIRCEASSFIHGRQACIIFSHDTTTVLF